MFDSNSWYINKTKIDSWQKLLDLNYFIFHLSSCQRSLQFLLGGGIQCLAPFTLLSTAIQIYHTFFRRKIWYLCFFLLLVDYLRHRFTDVSDDNRAEFPFNPYIKFINPPLTHTHTHCTHNHHSLFVFAEC